MESRTDGVISAGAIEELSHPTVAWRRFLHGQQNVRRTIDPLDHCNREARLRAHGREKEIRCRFVKAIRPLLDVPDDGWGIGIVRLFLGDGIDQRCKSKP